MDKFCLVAIMLFAIQRDMTNCSIVDVIDAIDRERDILSRLVQTVSLTRAVNVYATRIA